MSGLRKKHIKKRGRLFRAVVGIIALITAINLFFIVAFSGLLMFVFQALGQFVEDLPQIEDFAPTEIGRAHV